MNKTHTMKRICAWCNKELGTKEASASAKGMVTHGICQKCYDEVIGEMNDGNTIHRSGKEVSVSENHKR